MTCFQASIALVALPARSSATSSISRERETFSSSSRAGSTTGGSAGERDAGQFGLHGLHVDPSDSAQLDLGDGRKPDPVQRGPARSDVDTGSGADPEDVPFHDGLEVLQQVVVGLDGRGYVEVVAVVVVLRFERCRQVELRQVRQLHLDRRVVFEPDDSSRVVVVILVQAGDGCRVVFIQAGDSRRLVVIEAGDGCRVVLVEAGDRGRLVLADGLREFRGGLLDFCMQQLRGAQFVFVIPLQDALAEFIDEIRRQIGDTNKEAAP